MKNTKILITGATGGIGELLARSLVAQNHHLILTGRNTEKLKALQDEFLPLCGKVTIVTADLSVAEDIRRLAQMARDVSILINNAADFGPVKNILKVSEQEMMNAFMTNLMAPFMLIRAALREMIKSGFGRIINIGSTGGLGGYSLRVPYAMSKRALVALTESLYIELESGAYGKKYKGVNIQTFCVCPGPTRGDRLEIQIRDRSKATKKPIKETRRRFKEIQDRFLEPEEVVEKILVLLKQNCHEESTIIKF